MLLLDMDCVIGKKMERLTQTHFIINDFTIHTGALIKLLHYNNLVT